MRRLAIFFILISTMIGISQAEEIILNGSRITATIIDVRTPQEFSAGHIPGAINIPFDQIDSGIRALKGVSKESQILLYCRSGRRSSIARETLQKLGFQNTQDGGGMETLARSLKLCSAQQAC